MKPFKCMFKGCSRSFTAKASLLEHLQSHDHTHELSEDVSGDEAQMGAQMQSFSKSTSPVVVRFEEGKSIE